MSKQPKADDKQRKPEDRRPYRRPSIVTSEAFETAAALCDKGAPADDPALAS